MIRMAAKMATSCQLTASTPGAYRRWPPRALSFPTQNGCRLKQTNARLPSPTPTAISHGFEFHDRTPEQGERDRARDRALTACGWTVRRFTRREVIRDADACVTEVLRFLRRATGVLRVG